MIRSKTLEKMQRDEQLERLKQEGDPWDFLIIGGGATGLGSAVEAASRGYRVVLVEQHDFAKGTSSRSTKLLHGGVRYLKNGDISLVRSALRERGFACRNAPHLSRALGTINFSTGRASRCTTVFPAGSASDIHPFSPERRHFADCPA